MAGLSVNPSYLLNYSVERRKKCINTWQFPNYDERTRKKLMPVIDKSIHSTNAAGHSRKKPSTSYINMQASPTFDIMRFEDMWMTKFF